MTTLQGKTIWITGAARRIGRAIALACAAGGARVVVHYNTSHQDAEETANDIHTQGGEAFLVQADLSSLDEIEAAVIEVSAKWPRIDAVIHNAAVFFPTPFGDTAEEDWDTTINSNLKGPYFLTQALLPLLQNAPRPKLIFLGDEQTRAPTARLIPYAISKEGLRALAHGLGQALPKISTHFLELGPTLPPEDARIQAPSLTHSLDDVVVKVISLLK